MTRPALKDFISIRDLSREDIDHLIVKAFGRKNITTSPDFKAPARLGKVASLFFENSTRTRISSELAAINLGYDVTGFSGTEGTSVKKGEPLLDTVRMFTGYGVKAVFIRHPLAGASRYLADHLEASIINCGDGSNGHPTQTLLDLFTIQEKLGKIDGLHIAFVGDLKYGRTVHSLLQALEMFNVKITLVSPDNLNIPQWRIDDYEQSTGKKLEHTQNLNDVLGDLDVLYMTRIQRERFPAGIEGEIEFKKISGGFILKASDFSAMAVKEHLCILHPLPRDKNQIEIHTCVDQTHYAHYFTQAENGLYMREAILEALLSRTLKGKLKNNLKENSKGSLDTQFQELSVTNGEKNGEKLVYRLDTGLLIDHITPGKAELVSKILRLDLITDHEVVICRNIRSQKSGRKDVVAIHNMELTSHQLSQLALVAPDHTINMIKNKKVYQKGKAVLPETIENQLRCRNELCISRKEHLEYCPSRFHVQERAPLLQVRCHFCEQKSQGEQLELA